MKFKGFTLLEVMIAAVILSIGMLPLMVINRSSADLTLDAYYEFLAVQIAQEPIELFRAVGYPACTQLPEFKIGVIEDVSARNGLYPAEVEMFGRLITLNTSDLPFCTVTVEVFPKPATRGRRWTRKGRPVINITGVIPHVR